MRKIEAERIKQRPWVEVRPSNPDTLPPPFKRIEIETRPGAIFMKCHWYTRGYAVRDVIDGVTMPLLKRKLPFTSIIRWRLTDE